MTEPDRVKIMTLHLPLPLSVLSILGMVGDLYESCILKPVEDGSSDGMSSTIEVWAAEEKSGLAQDAVIARAKQSHRTRIMSEDEWYATPHPCRDCGRPFEEHPTPDCEAWA